MATNSLDLNFQKGTVHSFRLAVGSLKLLEDFSLYSWEFDKERQKAIFCAQGC
jgi:hypothetical protein